MGLKNTIIDITDRSPPLASLKYLKGQVLYKLGIKSHESGATLARADLTQNVKYIEDVVGDYFEYGNLAPDDLVGKHVLEIGPGDTLGVAMLLLAKGAASVTCVDRFKPSVNPDKNRQVCDALIRNLSSEQQARVAGLMDCFIHNKSSTDGRMIAAYGTAIEQLHHDGKKRYFDLVVSRAVLEHVYDLPEAWNEMVKVLKPDGRMLHKVDFRSHKFFNKVHPLYFLTFEEWAWRTMTSPDPTLNRQRSNVYRSLLDRTFRDYRIYYTSLLEHSELVPHPMEMKIGVHYQEGDLAAVGAIRPRLAKQFRDLSDLDLLASGIFIDCRLPVNPSGQ
jgi:SAM-dependent methyltransferase